MMVGRAFSQDCKLWLADKKTFATFGLPNGNWRFLVLSNARINDKLIESVYFEVKNGNKGCHNQHNCREYRIG